MSIAEKLITIAENERRVYDAGFVAGQNAEYQRCIEKHYIEIKKGDGTNKFSVDCDFKPDFFAVFSSFDYPTTKANTIIKFMQDFRCVGRRSALRINTDASGAQTNGFITTSAAERVFPYENGTVAYDGAQFSSASAKAYIFDVNTDYVAVCVKYTEESDEQIITRMVNALPDVGGTIEFSAVKVNGVFTTEEWQTLTATKPNWTFTLV